MDWKEIAYKALRQSPETVKEIPIEERSDEILLELLQNCPACYLSLTHEERSNPEIFMAALQDKFAEPHENWYDYHGYAEEWRAAIPECISTKS